jgi:hypothetical protein
VSNAGWPDAFTGNAPGSGSPAAPDALGRTWACGHLVGSCDPVGAAELRLRSREQTRDRTRFLSLNE